MSAKGLGIRVQTEHNCLVDQWILLLGPWTFLDLLASRTDNGLNLVAVDQTGNVRVADLSGWQADIRIRN